MDLLYLLEIEIDVMVIIHSYGLQSLQGLYPIFIASDNFIGILLFEREGQPSL